MVWAVILIGVGLVLGIAPNWFVGRSFLVMKSFAVMKSAVLLSGQAAGDRLCTCQASNSLWHLVSHDAVWAGAIAMLALPPLWFWWWRRSATALGGAIGAAISATAAAFVVFAVTQTPAVFMPSAFWQSARGTEHVEIGGCYWTLVAAAVMFAAAFIVAPTPPDPDAINALKVRGLVRRHRKMPGTTS